LDGAAGVEGEDAGVVGGDAADPEVGQAVGGGDPGEPGAVGRDEGGFEFGWGEEVGAREEGGQFGGGAGGGEGEECGGEEQGVEPVGERAGEGFHRRCQ
jgi:hypothetical protein